MEVKHIQTNWEIIQVQLTKDVNAQGNNAVTRMLILDE